MTQSTRLFLMRWILPGQLAGILPADWFRLLRENRYDVDPQYWPRACTITLASALNALFHAIEKRRHGSKSIPRLDGRQIDAPLFIIGHYRSGTSLLHQLFSLDPRFASPNTYQVLFPHTFLTTENVGKRAMAVLLPRTRIYDEVPFSFDVPQEDEFALCLLTLQSHFLRYVFPRRWAFYDRYLTLRNLSEAEIAGWQESLMDYLSKLTHTYEKPLVLKSPAHTGRIRQILELFPDARFVHIHRHPLVVFQSTRRMIAAAMPAAALQRPDDVDLDEAVIRSYLQMYEAFFQDRSLIPRDHLHEIAFADLEDDPINQMEDAYAALSLHGFSDLRPRLMRYIESIAGYQRNVYPPLDSEVRQRIRRSCHRCFAEWGYDESV